MKKRKIFIIIILTLMLTFCYVSESVNARPVEGATNTEIHSKSKKVSCGNVTDIPRKIPELTSYAVTVMQIAVPVILVIMGSLDLYKGITAQKEDEIKKGQRTFVKRLIVAGMIFFVIVFAKVIISVVADASSTNIIKCVDCFLSNDCK